MRKKRWEHVTDDEVRRRFHGEQLSYKGIAALYEDATIGKVAGRCRTLKLVRGTSKTLGARRPGRTSHAPPPAPPPKPKPVVIAEEVVQPAPVVVAREPAPKPKRKRAAAVVSIVAMRADAQKKPFERGKVRLEDLGAGSCKWPCGDPSHKDFGFCGMSQSPGSVYCDEHTRVAYQPRQQEKKKKAS